MKKIFIIITLFFSNILVANAQQSPGSLLKDAGDASHLSNPSLPDVIGNVINGVLGFLGTIFLVLIIYAGFLWMTAGGNEEKISKAQKIIRGAVIGLLIVVLSFAITRYVFTTLISAGL